MQKKIFVLAFFLGLFLQVFSQDNYLVRYPALSPDGTMISFSYQGDIWVKNLESNVAPVRLTIHEAYDQAPVWSPDGENIAFTSDRYGRNDIFTIPAKGGKPMRLTYHSASDQLSDWTQNENLLFTTNRNYAEVEWDSEIYTINEAGGTPERMMDAFGNMPVESPNGRFVAFVRGACRVAREAYNGPANKDIWLFDKESGDYTQLTKHKTNDIYPRWANDNMLYFLSARNGRYNIHKLSLTANGKAGGEITAVTSFEDEGIRYFDIAKEGSLIAWEKDLNIYTKDASEEPKALDLQLTQDYRFVPREFKTFTSRISEYEVSPSGKYVAFGIRGELFLAKSDKENKRTVRLTDHPYRDQDISWLNDSTLLFVSDRDGQKDIYMVQSADAEEPNLYKTLKRKVTNITNSKKDEMQPLVSPKGDKIVYQTGDDKTIVASISPNGKISNEIILHEGWNSPSGIAWSPDGKWLAYSQSNLNYNAEIYIHKADNSQGPVNVSMHPRGDYSPVWSPDGSKLGFMSGRNNGDNDVWFAWLKEKDWEKTRQDWEMMEDDKEKDSDGVEVNIDLKNIHRRLVQVTSLPGNESDVAISKDGETFFFVTNRNSRQRYNADQDLYQVKWDGSDRKALTKGNTRPYAVQMDPKANNLYYISRGGSLSFMDASKGKSSRIPFKAVMDIEYAEEREQKFEEAWGIINDNFYDPNFHGQNWEALKKQYKPYCMAASTDKDFQDMFNNLLGQINASHMGLYGGSRADNENERTGLLGVELKTVKNGMEVLRVVPDSPADKEESKLVAGDIITAVDGIELHETTNFYSLFTNKAGEQIILNVDGKNGNREVIIRPTSSLRDEKYEAWVERKSKLTDQYSNGRLGYIHIQGMNWTSFERFERELAASGINKEGIVIDVRFNGGGWTTDYLMAVLSVKQHAYTIPRGAADNLEEENQKFKEYYPYSERLPLSAWVKPSVAMCNERSYSNAEIFSHAYKSLGIGKLVGQPTFGAVISTGGAGLIDGSYIRIPGRAWYVKNSGMNMENGPAVPDILVENAPNAKALEQDAQLKKAVETLLKQIDQ